MREAMTYSLVDGSTGNSNSYYEVVRSVAARVVPELEQRHGGSADAFTQWISGNVGESARSRTELLLDLLVLGVLWRECSGPASRLPVWLATLIAWIAAMRRRGGTYKRVIDCFRGVINTALLARRPSDQGRGLEPNLSGLERLGGWLAATAEYRREGERIALWQEWLRTLTESEANAVIGAAVQTGAWFAASASATLGRFTERVPAFQRDHLPSHRWNEDIISVGKTRTEYHLAMVGAELMNSAFRRAFLSRKRRVVLLPSCMRVRTRSCEATPTPRGLVCTGCTPSCRVHQTTVLGHKEGFEVRVLHHASDLSVWAPKDGEAPVAIVGVACMAPLLAGGWELRALGIAAQCVPLDACGCSSHWARPGRTTDLNLVELRRRLGSPTRAGCREYPCTRQVKFAETRAALACPGSTAHEGGA